jgi:glycerol-3-phosphate dehydrogenase
VLTFCLSRPDDTPLGTQTEITCAEIAFIARHEGVVTLSDIILRRTTLAIRGLLSEDLLDKLVAATGEELGWNAEEREHQLSALAEDLSTYHGVTLDGRQTENLSRSRICV